MVALWRCSIFIENHVTTTSLYDRGASRDRDTATRKTFVGLIWRAAGGGDKYG